MVFRQPTCSPKFIVASSLIKKLEDVVKYLKMIYKVLTIKLKFLRIN